ncbi:MAG: peptidoglycan D,D-transpeptidase FtsI family protein [Microgenomates group bacterium]
MSNWRINFLLGFFILAGVLVGYRLFYWQVLNSEQLAAAAEKQHWVSFEIPAKRGEILASDGFPLVTNQEAFLVFASIPDLEEKPESIAAKLAPLLSPNVKETEELIKQRLKRDDLVWVPLQHKVSRRTKEILEDLKIAGIGFEEEQKRGYPEGSSAAHLLGFVGLDINGRDKGYFGLEGYYDLELKGQPGIVRREKDASGKPILVGENKGEKEKPGRSLQTTIDRSVQFIVEEKLKKGLDRYGAVSGSVVVMEPKTGAILAMASLPTYDPANYWKYDKSLFPNPVIASSYEPGSTFKVLVMAAALNEGVVTPQTRCEKCDGPRNISGYTIRTWNDKYFPDSTMVEVIQHSDNVGMVFVGEKLGSEKLVDYLEKFGFGQPTGIDLQEESSPRLRPKSEWKPIDLATASFGQGIAVTPLQMVRAVGVIANEGRLVKPFVVKKVIGEDGEKEIPIKEATQVIKPTTARVVTEMMVNAVDNGEAKWAKPKGFRIAGKTGTAQIPVAGHYDEEKTIASFVGFAPADEPKFVMLVTLREPTSSPWGSETAAPLWFDIAKELFTYYGILPE